MKNEKEIKKLEKAVADINKRIDKLKEEKQELEVGKWYKQNPTGHLFCCTSFSKAEGYGFYGCGSWFDNAEFARFEPYTIEPATNEEVVSALITEAKKRYEKTDRVECLYDGFHEPMSKQGYDFCMDGYLWHNGNACIFKDGQWAEIIEEPKVFINGREVAIKNSIVTIGCTSLGCKSSILGTLDHLRNCGINYLQHEDCAREFNVTELINAITKL